MEDPGAWHNRAIVSGRPAGDQGDHIPPFVVRGRPGRRGDRLCPGHGQGGWIARGQCGRRGVPGQLDSYRCAGPLPGRGRAEQRCARRRDTGERHAVPHRRGHGERGGERRNMRDPRPLAGCGDRGRIPGDRLPMAPRADAAIDPRPRSRRYHGRRAGLAGTRYGRDRGDWHRWHVDDPAR